MSYTPIGWENLPNTTTPINKTNLNKMDTQIKNNADDIATNTTNIATNTGDISALDTRLTSAEQNISSFNLNIFETPTNVTATNGSVSNSLQVARNEDGSLAKIYGNISFSNWTVPSSYFTQAASFQTSLRPTSTFTIANAGWSKIINNSNQETINPVSLTVNTSGVVTTTGFSIWSDTAYATIVLLPMLYWIKDFGDEPDEPTA